MSYKIAYRLIDIKHNQYHKSYLSQFKKIIMWFTRAIRILIVNAALSNTILLHNTSLYDTRIKGRKENKIFFLNFIPCQQTIMQTYVHIYLKRKSLIISVLYYYSIYSLKSRNPFDNPLHTQRMRELKTCNLLSEK